MPEQLSKITATSVKLNLDIALRQQETCATTACADTNPPFPDLKDPTIATEKSKAFNRHHAYLTAAQGMRPYQEDRAGLAAIQLKKAISKEILAVPLCETIQQLADEYKNQPAGSTLSAFIIHNDFVIAANVGDSRVIFIGKSNEKFMCRRLSWDHKPNQEDEASRILKSGGEVTPSDVSRLNGILAVSRALGDSSVGPGLSAEPTITWLQTTQYAPAYVIACTDGITDFVHENDIEKAFSSKTAISQMADYLQTLALTRGSSDNKTVLMTPVQANQPNDLALIGFVADGHGGETVSELIKQNIFSFFAANLQKKNLIEENTNLDHLL